MNCQLYFFTIYLNLYCKRCNVTCLQKCISLVGYHWYLFSVQFTCNHHFYITCICQKVWVDFWLLSSLVSNLVCVSKTAWWMMDDDGLFVTGQWLYNFGPQLLCPLSPLRVSFCFDSFRKNCFFCGDKLACGLTFPPWFRQNFCPVFVVFLFGWTANEIAHHHLPSSHNRHPFLTSIRMCTLN